MCVGLFVARTTVHVRRTHSVVVRIYKRLKKGNPLVKNSMDVQNVMPASH